MNKTMTLMGGQAMTEFNVSVAFVFLPLFVFVPTMGKLIDIQHQNQLAARYATWERTVWFDNLSGDNRNDFVISSDPWESVAIRDEAAITNTIENRFFKNYSQAGAPAFITNDDTQRASGKSSGVWTFTQSQRDMYGGTTVLDYSSSDTDDTPSFLYKAWEYVGRGMQIIKAPIDAVLKALGNDNEDWLELPLFTDSKTFYKPIVQTRVDKGNAHGGGDSIWDRVEGSDFTPGIESAVFQVWDGVFESRGGILADGWSAQSVKHYKDRVDDHVFAELFDFAIVDDIKYWVSFLEGGPENSAIYKFEMTHIPIDPLPAVDGGPAEIGCDDGICGFDE